MFPVYREHGGERDPRGGEVILVVGEHVATISKEQRTAEVAVGRHTYLEIIGTAVVMEDDWAVPSGIRQGCIPGQDMVSHDAVTLRPVTDAPIARSRRMKGVFFKRPTALSDGRRLKFDLAAGLLFLICSWAWAAVVKVPLPHSTEQSASSDMPAAAGIGAFHSTPGGTCTPLM